MTSASGPAQPAAEPEEAVLAERARNAHVVVVGAGIAGLVAALQCAELGIRVTVLESAPRAGGAIRGARVAGLDLDTGAESFATRGGTVRALIDRLGLAAEIVRPEGGRAWVTGLPGAAPLPAGGVLGIPENPWAADVRRVIGWRGAWRAYLDRLRPPLTIGHQHSLGALVRTRMGERVLDRLVAPVVSGVYSARPDDIDVDIAAPGLNAALTRVGSLAGAVAVVRGERAPGTTPGAAVEGIAGGMTTLVDALLSRLRDLGATVRTRVVVDTVARHDEAWFVTATETDTALELTADAVIVATDETAARHLLADIVPALTAPASAPVQPRVDVVTLVLDVPALDASPRGTGVLTVPGTSRAKALTHSTAKWAWLAAAARVEHPHRHVVRVSFGAQGEPPATADLPDREAYALAVAEASTLLGVPIEPGALVGAHIERFLQSQPASAIGQAESAARARTAVRALPGLGVTGAWLAGTGLAQVVPDAEAEAEHIRRGLLWGADARA